MLLFGRGNPAVTWITVIDERSVPQGGNLGQLPAPAIPPATAQPDIRLVNWQAWLEATFLGELGGDITLVHASGSWLVDFRCEGTDANGRLQSLPLQTPLWEGAWYAVPACDADPLLLAVVDALRAGQDLSAIGIPTITVPAGGGAPAGVVEIDVLQSETAIRGHLTIPER
jgi:hypothetical protein